MCPGEQIERIEDLSSDVHSTSVVRRGKWISEHSRHICSVALVGSDLAAFLTSVSVAFWLSNPEHLPTQLGQPPLVRAVANVGTLGAAWHGWGSAVVLACLFAWFGHRGHYTSRIPSWTVLGDVVTTTVLAFAADVVLTLGVYGRPLQLEGVLRWVLLCPCLWIFRALTRQLLCSVGLWSIDTLVVAHPDDLDAAIAVLGLDPALGYEVVGSIRPDKAALQEERLARLIAERQFNFVVAAVGGACAGQDTAVIGALRRTGVAIGLVPVLPTLPVAGFRRHYFLGSDLPILLSNNNLITPLNRFLKCLFDQTVAVVLLVLLAPLLIGLAVLVRADGGTALYRHRRIGSHGRTFSCLKFRTMVTDAEQQLQRVLAGDPAAATEWAANQKLANDPRITRIGQFLRCSSLDELPQLLNVLRGEMSLVGPRPIVSAEIDRYGEDIDYYFEAKPGITGLWQVSGRNETSYARRVKLDVWYVKNWTIWHDVAILLKTIPAVLLRRGAH